MGLKCKQFTDIPEWAIFALEYGTNEDASLNEEDIEQINAFVDENFPNGYYMVVDWDSYTSFCPYPRFGLATGTYTVVFYFNN